MMSQPENLQALRRAYARGEIDAATYRTVRRALVTAIASGALPPSVAQQLVVIPAQAQTLPPTEPLRTQLMAGSSVVAPVLTTPAAPGMPFKWIATGTAGVLMIGAIVLFWPHTPSTSKSAANNATQTTAAEVQLPAHRALAQFLRDADWSQTGITVALRNLNALRENTSGTDATKTLVRKLQDAVAARVEEESALIEISDYSSAANAGLIALARALDISVTKLETRLPTTPPMAATHTPAAPPPTGLANEPIPTQPSSVSDPTLPASIAETKTVAVTTAAPSAAVIIAPPAATIGQTAPAASHAVTKSAPEPERKKAADQKVAATISKVPAPHLAKAKNVEVIASEAAPPVTTAQTLAVLPTRETRGDKGCNALVGINLGAGRTRPCRDTLASGGDGPSMVGVPRGNFEMGGDRSEELPKHQVQIDYPLAVAKYETSVAEFQQFAIASGTALPPQPNSAPIFPVVDVTWDDANAYAQWLSSETGARYRLPSEAEWEYVARAGVSARWPDGDNSFNAGSIISSELGERSAPAPVTRGAINRYKLVDTLGNVSEWVLDGWQGNFNGAPSDGSAVAGSGQKVVRGGSFKDKKERITLSARSAQAQGARAETTGFRLVRELK